MEVQGGTPRKIEWGVRPIPKTLTLFMTKVCNIPYPIYDLTKNRNPIFYDGIAHQNPVSDLHYNWIPNSDDEKVACHF